MIKILRFIFNDESSDNLKLVSFIEKNMYQVNFKAVGNTKYGTTHR